MRHFFASASHGLTWRSRGSTAPLEESFDIGASALVTSSGRAKFEVTDDVSRACAEQGIRDLSAELRARARVPEDLVARSLELAPEDALLRFTARSRIAVSEGAEHAFDERFVVISSARDPRLSIVAGAGQLEAGCGVLDSVLRRAEGPPCDVRSLPFLWMNGTAGVLFHEAAGHASEESAAVVKWPEWLQVSDDPAEGGMARDDTGAPTGVRDLLRDAPSAMRRESFRDVPLRRMTAVAVSGRSSFAPPRHRIEILLVGGGSYDPLTDEFSVSVTAADLVRDGESSPIRPFILRERRGALASRIAGEAGEAVVYPGVICGREGQKLFVRTSSADLLTEAFSR